MDEEMKEVHIACAGAGKTYSIAREIFEIHNKCPEDKNIYAITFTNYAVDQIKKELLKRFYNIPDNIIIETVHGFLLSNIIYPYSFFIKKETISSCSIEELSKNNGWRAKRIKELKDFGIIHAAAVPQYAKSLLVAQSNDNKLVKRLKEIAENYFIADIFCLFVDEAQDMEKCFFDLMIQIIDKLQHFYFVGDPYQSLKSRDKYKLFTEAVKEKYRITTLTNMVSRRIPLCIIPICNEILDQDSQICSCSAEEGIIEYVRLSELDQPFIKKLSNVFSYIKEQTNTFSTAKTKSYLTHELTKILSFRFPKYDLDAIKHAIVQEIHDKGLSKCLHRLNIVLDPKEYAILACQFSNEKATCTCVNSIEKIKGLEKETSYFIICNSLLEVLLGIKNNHNKETKLLYVALTRTKNRLLLIIDDNEVMIRNFKNRDIDFEDELKKKGIPKASIKDWF